MPAEVDFGLLRSRDSPRQDVANPRVSGTRFDRSFRARACLPNIQVAALLFKSGKTAWRLPFTLPPATCSAREYCRTRIAPRFHGRLDLQVERAGLVIGGQAIRRRGPDFPAISISQYPHSCAVHYAAHLPTISRFLGGKVWHPAIIN